MLFRSHADAVGFMDTMVKRADRIRMVSMKPVKPEPPKTDEDA